MNTELEKNTEASTSLNMDVALGPHQKTQTNITNQATAESAPRYLIVKGDFAKVSPFAISKNIYSLLGQVKSLKKIKEGLLVETISAAQSRKLQSLKTLCNITIEVEAHRTLNYAKGIIWCRDLLNCSLDEILEELKDEGVTEVKRMTARVEGIVQETPRHILTFNKPIIPRKIKVAFYSLEVKPYIPPPMRCFRCQRFGHTALRCNEDPKCVCGKAPHEGNPCENPIKCVNCGEPHSSRYRGCIKFKEEVAIQELKVNEKISYFEAKKKITSTTPTTGISYASAAANKPNIDLSEITATLFPVLLPAIKEIILNALEGASLSQCTTTDRALTCNEESMDDDTESYLTSDVSTEKRKRNRGPPTPEDEIISQPFKTPQPDPKRKKGWPKGKSRKEKT